MPKEQLDKYWEQKALAEVAGDDSGEDDGDNDQLYVDDSQANEEKIGQNKEKCLTKIQHLSIYL